MSHIEMDFYNFVRQLNTFFQSEIVKDGINRTAEGSKRSVAAEVIAVQQALKNLQIVLNLNTPKFRSKSPSDAEIKSEGQLNPFNFIKVEVATHIIGSTEIKGVKMKVNEVKARLES